MRSVVRRGSMRPTLATILLVLLIIVIGTAVPFPLFVPLRESLEPQVPPLLSIVRPYIASLVMLGSRVAVIMTSAVANLLDWEQAQPPSVDAWLLAAQRIGAFAGMVVAAALPAWALVGWARRPMMVPGGRPAPLRHVPLALAIVWTAAVARPLFSVVATVAFPVDTWLMLPTASASQAAEHPPRGWCAFELHPSAFACEAERVASTARKDENVNGFAFAGARCVSAADVPHPSCEPKAEPGS